MNMSDKDLFYEADGGYFYHHDLEDFERFFMAKYIGDKNLMKKAYEKNFSHVNPKIFAKLISKIEVQYSSYEYHDQPLSKMVKFLV